MPHQELEDALIVDGPLIVARYMSRACDPWIQRRIEATEALIAKGVRPVLLIVLGVNSAPPGTATRAAMSAIRRRHDGRLAAVAYVMQTMGFGAAAHHSVVSAQQIVHRGKHPEHVFATVEEAAAWLVPYVPGRTAQDIVRLADSKAAPTPLRGMRNTS